MKSSTSRMTRRSRSQRSGTGTFFTLIRHHDIYRFNTEAKETLLSACARSQRVTRFSLIGPAKRDYGNPEAVIDWVGQQGGACKLVGDDKGHLSGSGENQRIMTFEKVDGGSSPQRALAFDD